MEGAIIRSDIIESPATHTEVLVLTVKDSSGYIRLFHFPASTDRGSAMHTLLSDLRKVGVVINSIEDFDGLNIRYRQNDYTLRIEAVTPS